MQTILKATFFLVLILGTAHTSEAQLLNKLKKKAEKKVEKAVEGNPSTKKSAPKGAATTKKTTTAKSTTTKKTTTMPKSTQPSWIDTTDTFNAFWKQDIAQRLLKTTGVEPFEYYLAHNKARAFTDSYVKVQEMIANNNRPNNSEKFKEEINVLLDVDEMDKILSEAPNNNMEGKLSDTPFWKETEKTLQEWKKIAESWENSPAVHFSKVGIKFKTNTAFLDYVEIDPASNEDYFELNLKLKGIEEPKKIKFKTEIDKNKRNYTTLPIRDGVVSALDNGYYAFTYKENNRFFFGETEAGAKDAEKQFVPLFPEKVLEGCVVCEAHQGDMGTIYFATQGEPLKEKDLDFYANDPAWNGAGPFYSRIVVPQSLNNIISKSNPWQKGNIKYRWYVKGENENIYMDPLPKSDEGSDVADHLTWWQEMYEGIGVQDVPSKTFKQVHHLLMDKGPGNYTLVGELVMREGDGETGYMETVLAKGEKEVDLSESDYKRLFVGPKKGIGAYRLPEYHSAASAAISAAAKRDNKNVKAVYMTPNSKWYWVVNALGVKLHEQNDGVVLIYSEDGKAHFSFATAKRDNGRYTVTKDALSQRTSKRNFTIK